MSERLEFDIVVVGAGPAGSMSAKYAAIGGRKVALLERFVRVSDPVRCGEGIGIKGLTRSVTVKDSWILSTIKQIDMVSPSGIKVSLNDVDESFVVDRTVMDNDLIADAVQAGAQHFPNTPVLGAKRLDNGWYECHSIERTFVARCVIVADGVESRIARGLGWNTTLSADDIHTCSFARVRHRSIAADTCSLHYGSSIAPGGYAWVFPRGEGEANVGLGILGSRCQAGEPERRLLEFVKKTFADAEISHIHCGGVPAAKWLSPLVRDGAMVVGDAARQVNCVSGGGIAYALYAGKTAGTIAAEAITGEGVDYRHLKRYQKLWASDCGKHQVRSHAVKSLMLTFSDDYLDKLARSLSSRKGKKLSRFTVFARAFVKHPLLLLRGAVLFK